MCARGNHKWGNSGRFQHFDKLIEAPWPHAPVTELKLYWTCSFASRPDEMDFSTDQIPLHLPQLGSYIAEAWLPVHASQSSPPSTSNSRPILFGVPSAHSLRLQHLKIRVSAILWLMSFRNSSGIEILNDSIAIIIVV